MKNSLLTFATMIGLTFMAGSPVFATTDTWNGGTADWNTIGNWSGGIPINSSTATFTGSANPNITLSSNGIAANLLFNTATAYTIGTVGGSSINLALSGSVTSTASTDTAIQTINAPLILGTVGTGGAFADAFQSNSTTASAVLNIGGAITGVSAAGSTSITFAGTNLGINTVSGIISDGGGSNATSLTFNSNTANNNWYVTGTNTYTGGTATGGNGTLMIGNNSALGSGTLTLSGTGVIQADGTARSLSNAVLVSSSGVIGGASNLTFGGAFTFVSTGGTVTVNDTGVATISGNTYLSNVSGTGGNATFITGPSGNLVLSGPISDFNGSGIAGALNLTAGTGSTITLSGTDTYGSGKVTTINSGNGSVVINNNSAFGSSAVTLASGATIAAGANAPSISNNVTLSGAANFVGSNNLTITGTTAFTTTAANFANESSGTLTLGNVNLSTGVTATTTNLTGAGNTTITGTIADGTTAASILAYGGDGTLTLSGHTTSTGGWTLRSGTVVLDDTTDTGAKLGSGALSLGGVNLQLKGGSGTQTVTSTVLNGGGQASISQTGGGSETIALGAVTITFQNGTGPATSANFQSGAATTSTTHTVSTGNAGIFGGYATVGSQGSAFWATSGTTGTTPIVAYTGETALPASGGFQINYLVNDSFSTSVASVNALRITTDGSAGSTPTLTLTANMALAANGGILDSAASSSPYLINGTGIITMVSAGMTIQQYGNGTLEIDNQIVGSQASGGIYFQKAGPGTLILGGANAWKNTFYINQGAVSAGSDTNLGGFTGSLTVASSTIGSTTVTLASTAPATLVSGSAFLGSTVSSVSGTTVTLAAGANASLTNASATYGIASGLSLDGGTLEATGTFSLSEPTAGLATPNRAISLGANGGTFQVDGSNILTAPGVISNLNAAGPGFLTKTGNGTLILSATNTYTGGTNINAGTLQVGATAALGTASITNSVTLNGGALDIAGFSPSVGALTLASGSIINSGVSTATLNAFSYNMQSGTVSAILANNGTGATALTKSTSGTVTLSAANTYTGGTTVSNGTLLVTNTSGSGTGKGDLSVARGATFGGTGSSVGNLTATTSFAIGSATGSGTATVLVGHTSAADTNTTGSLALQASSSLPSSSTIQNTNLVFNLNSATAGAANQLSVANTAITFNTLGSINTTLTLNVEGNGVILPFTPYVLIAGTGTTITGLTGTPTATLGQYAGLSTFVNSQNQNQIVTTGSLGGLTLAFGSGGAGYENSYLFLVNTGGVDDIEVEVVPEPGTWALMLGGLTLLVVWQRRKSKLS
jgi:fibronectin-binding autotransporter adhesin